MTSPSEQHVLIAGGGLGGTALAIALAHRRIRSTIFEIRPVPGDIGGGLMLAPNALRVLDNVIGVYEHVKSSGFAFEYMGIYTDAGYKFGKVSIGDVENTGYPAVRVTRPALHRALLDECERLKDHVTIKYGMKFETIDEDDSAVTVHFEDGSSLQGDILVGADGIHSLVRKHVLGDRAPVPTYSGLCGVGSTIARSSVNTPPGVTFPGIFFSSIGMIMVIPVDPEGETLGWAAQKVVQERDREQWKTFATSGEAARVTRDDYGQVEHEPIHSLMRGLVDEEIHIWPPYEIPDIPTWHTRRVCLIGDAAHAIPPTGGQGSAQAFEDAGFLARLLASETAFAKGYDALFGHYEKVRKARFKHVREVTKLSGDTRRGSGPGLNWFLRKLGMWVYFTLKGGVVRDLRITNYDVMEESIDF